MSVVKNPVVPPAAPKRKFKKRYVVLGLFALGMVAGAVTPAETPEEAAARIVEEQKAESERVISRCKSQLESSMRVETRMRLRDPSSFEDRGTIWLPKKTKDGYIAIMTYGARNGFGGMNTGYVEVDAVVSEQECALKTINFPVS